MDALSICNKVLGLYGADRQDLVIVLCYVVIAFNQTISLGL